jgi:hypothetical protein
MTKYKIIIELDAANAENEGYFCKLVEDLALTFSYSAKVKKYNVEKEEKGKKVNVL